MAKRKHEGKKRIVAYFTPDELDFLLSIKEREKKTWTELILDLAGYEKKENKVGSTENGGCSK